ncbi:methionyl-tRNA formyltransferase, mitochondrial [Neocloeon triangulifer]|uniref:methionyl-tRNA formyltransferase, mitochondrial n=1 Tax=Neocloeon triangulifer TaxID=2078957 RepID=UPI00286F5F85|nr:methionyl-tRNA formyltransferase, mitochondrial [Neocloeon triangulifer]
MLSKMRVEYILAKTFVRQNFKSYRRFSSSGPPWSVVFFGSDNFALSSLQMLHQELISGHYVRNLSVVCAYMKCPVAQYSIENKLNIIPWKPHIEDLQRDKPEIGLVVSFGHLIPQSIISAFPLGMVNVHASILPRWRGAAPIIHTVLNGETESGVTLMKIRPHKFDCGEIINTSKISVGVSEDAESLTARLAQLGAKELQFCLRNLTSSLSQATPQKDSGVTYAPKVSPIMSACVWTELSAAQLHHRHLALHHVHPLHADWHGQQIKFLDCVPCERSTDSAPGLISFSKKSKHLEVACNENSVLAIKSLQLKGKKMMTAMDFVNGFLKRVPRDLWKFGNGDVS